MNVDQIMMEVEVSLYWSFGVFLNNLFCLPYKEDYWKRILA